MLNQDKRALKLAAASILIIIPFLLPQNKRGALIRLSSYPKEEKDYYFRPVVDLDSFQGKVYGLSNFENRILTFDFLVPKLVFMGTISGPGQGPNELQYPMRISVSNGKIAVKHSGYFSIFKTSGEFVSRFKAFTNNDHFALGGERIFWLNPMPHSNQLIEVYSLNGDLELSFCDKFLHVNNDAIKDRFLVNSFLYEGHILIDDKSVLYFSSRFGQYWVFSFQGKATEHGEMSGYFFARGKSILEYNSDLLDKVNHGIDLSRIEGSKYPRSVIFEDVAYLDGRFYFISSDIKSSNGKDTTTFEIYSFTKNPFRPLSHYSISRENQCRLDGFTVVRYQDSEYAIISISDMSEGFFLETYKIPDEQK